MPVVSRDLVVLSVTLLLLVGKASAEIPANQLSEAERRGGWKLLFDGTSADHWRNYRKEDLSSGWSIQDGTIVRTGKGAGDIVTKDTYKFFEISLEYRISKGGNSGLMFHVTEDQRAPWHSGPEVQIQDNVDGHDPQKAGWLYQLYKPQKPAWAIRFENQVGFKSPDIDDATRPAGEWNRLYLRISPAKCEVAVNGVSYYYFVMGNADWNERVAASKFSRFPEFGKAGEGHICLQDHGNEVAFRNIKIRELSADGDVPNPVDGSLPLKGVAAFPNLKWEGWTGEDEQGRVRSMRPISLKHSGDNTNRLYLASQRGVIYSFENSAEATEASRFLDLSDRVQDWKQDDEEGLLGLAFHPKFAENGQFFVYYSSSETPRLSRVSRFRVSKEDPLRADPDSEEVVIDLPQPFSNHNGGSIAFGNDGHLYIALGDGGGRNDPVHHGQNLSSWMGSVLRIDVDRKAGGKNYAVPSDNPFLKRDDALPEIYAYGFRNIWRLSVDRETGTIWAPDVGQDLWEEVNVLQPGGNYGWSQREGTHAFGGVTSAEQDPHVDPVWEYDHQVGKSITGGVVYRGKQHPSLAGRYLYADFVSGRIWALKYDWETGKAAGNVTIQDSGVPILAFGLDQHGEAYYLVETVNGKGIFRFEAAEAAE